MKNKYLLFICLLQIFIVLFNSSVVSMSVVYILSDLGSSSMTASYATVFYGVGNVLTAPLGSGLKERIPTHTFYLICIIPFILSTYLAASAPTYPLFIFYRFMQGVSSGPFYILLTSLLGSYTDMGGIRKIRQYTLTSFICTPALGASWAGWISYDYHWRDIFYINTAIMIVAAYFIYKELKNHELKLFYKPFDWFGYTIFVIGFLALSIFITLGQELDWFRSDFLVFTFIVAIIFFPFFFFYSLKHPYPIFDLRQFKTPLVAFSLLNLWVLFASYYGMTLLLSIWLTLYVRYTVIWVSVLLAATIVSAGIFTRVVKNYLDKHKVWLPLIAGILCLGFSSLYTCQFNYEVDLFRVAISRTIAGFGFALLLPSLVHLFSYNATKETNPKLFSLFQITRASASALGGTIFYTIWLRRQVFYYDRLGGEITPYSPIYNLYYKYLSMLGLQKDQLNPTMNDVLTVQATSLALDDTFYLMGLICLAFLIPALYCYKKRETLYVE
jgi:DHA2 family multidrug resistance protein